MSYRKFNPNAYKQPKTELRGEDTIYPYGKHSGKTLKEIIVTDLDYFNWLENNNSIEGLTDIIKEMKIKYQSVIFDDLKHKADYLKSVETKEPYKETIIIVEFTKNLKIFSSDTGEELFAYYKHIFDGVFYNIIFPSFKKFTYNDIEYALPLTVTLQAKRIKNKTLELKVEPRDPYLHKFDSKKVVQNLVVKEFKILT